MKKMFVIMNAVVVTATLSLSLMANPQNNNQRISPKPPVLTVGQKVMLPCKNPGSHQDVSKNPTITNTTGKTIKKGAKVNWSASDSDKGVITLDKDMAPNGTITALGNAGQSYSCQAWTLQ
ncbi:MAG: hypothetical protein ABI977_33695 [Acidobacteriota bacterium]